ncbi:MAG: magnesium transporter [Dehalococcoidia bacterium]
MATEQETAELAERIEEALRGPDVNEAADALTSIHPADRADLYERLDSELQEAFLSLLSAEEMAELMEYLDDEVREEVTARMPRATLARVLDRMSNDEAVDVLRSLPAADAARVLSGMATAQEVTPLLGHDDESAGGLMTRGYVALHPEMTAQQAITFLRLRKPTADEAYYLYVLDVRNRLQGVVNLRELLVSDPDAPIVDVMTADAIAVEPETDREEVARLIQRYRLRALPVVDENRVLVGIITADDAMEVASEEATEDMYRMVGLLSDDSVYAPVLVSARRRVPWLAINLVAAFLAAAMVAAFEDTIAKAAALAVFMPVVAGQGGNSGIQSITIVVRALALGEIQGEDARRVLVKEVAIGLVKGLAFGTLIGLLAWGWQGEPAWGFVVGVALLLNMVMAGFLGAVIPLSMRALKLDPAIASGIFLTMATDALGFLFLLGLGALLIDQLT